MAAFGIILIVSLGISLSNEVFAVDSSILLLLMTIFIVSVAVIVREFKLGRYFSLLMAYSVMLMYELLSAGLASAIWQSLPTGGILEPYEIHGTLEIGLIGYLLFLAGYFVRERIGRAKGSVSASLPVTTTSRLRIPWSKGYSISLAAVLLISILGGFVQFVQRVRYAGGLGAFIEIAYQLRFGTQAESAEENLLIVGAGLFGGIAVGLLGLAAVAWQRGILTPCEKVTFTVLGSLLAVAQITLAQRSLLFLSVLSLVAIRNSERPLRRKNVILLGLAIGVGIVFVNYVHQLLYYLTANWDYSTFGESLTMLIGPLGHFGTLAEILRAHNNSWQALSGRGLLESVFFFIPRVVWDTKAPSEEYGTILVQVWAGLPSWYQMAVTNVGELLAHFGYPGVLGLLVYGWLFSWFDSFSQQRDELRCGLYCILFPRVLVIVGMGISALSITAFYFVMFLAIAWGLRTVWSDRSEAGFGQRLFSPAP